MKKNNIILNIQNILFFIVICFVFCGCECQKTSEENINKGTNITIHDKVKIHTKNSIINIKKQQNTQQSYSNVFSKVNNFDLLLKAGKVINNLSGNATNLNYIADIAANFSEQQLLNQASQIINNGDNYIYAAMALSNIYVNSTNENSRNEALLLLAKMCRKTGATEDERKYLEKLLKRCDESNYSIRGDVLLRLAENHAYCFENEKALQYYEGSIVACKQFFPERHNTIGNIELRMIDVLLYSNPEKALELLTTFNEKHPDCSSQRKKQVNELIEGCKVKLKPENTYYREILNKTLKSTTALEMKSYIDNYKVNYPDSQNNEKLEKIYMHAVKYEKTIEKNK